LKGKIEVLGEKVVSVPFLIFLKCRAGINAQCNIIDAV
jgi:hypothetical protein